MRKIYLYFIIVFLNIIVIISCSSSDLNKKISMNTGIDLSDGAVSKSIDSHGGFHGDGITYIEMSFSDKQGVNITKIIDKEKSWSRLPLNDNLNTAIYGKENSNEYVGSLFSGDSGNELFPKVENGYYFFVDRHRDSKEVTDYTDILNRNSFNFTIAIYNTDNQTLYYGELDT